MIKYRAIHNDLGHGAHRDTLPEAMADMKLRKRGLLTCTECGHTWFAKSAKVCKSKSCPTRSDGKLIHYFDHHGVTPWAHTVQKLIGDEWQRVPNDEYREALGMNEPWKTGRIAHAT